MICLHCGYCCKSMMVIIVDKPQLGPIESNLIFHEGTGKPCKHLRGEKPGEYECNIHNEKWYKETPCFAFTQFERKESPCRLGEKILQDISSKSL
jgi:hypothetical protein